MNVALYSALLCPAWGASPKRGALGLRAPQGLLPHDCVGKTGRSRTAGRAQQTQEASGPQQGSRQAVWAAPTQCLWDRVKVVNALPGPQYPGPLLFKVESLHFPNNQNCEELTHGAGWRLFHSWVFFLLPKSSVPRSRGRSRSYPIPLGLHSAFSASKAALTGLFWCTLW